MRLLVTGGQHFDDRELAVRSLCHLHQLGISALIHGDAPGADTLARQWAEAQQGIEIVTRPAEWKKYGMAAGPIRNRTLLWERPDLLLAFPGNNGTRHMVTIARQAGLPIIFAVHLTL